MPISLYMDHHVPVAITAGLRRRGVDVLTAFEDGQAQQEDEVILERATVSGGPSSRRTTTSSPLLTRG